MRTVEKPIVSPVTSRSRSSRDRVIPENELLLLLMSTNKRRAEHSERIVALASEIDDETFFETLGRQGVIALATKRLVAHAPGMMTERLQAWVRNAAFAEELRMLGIEQTTRVVVRALEAAGIQALPLKGPTLGERIYGSPGLRSSTDVDLLVAGSDLKQAVRVVRDLGWGPSTDAEWNSGLPCLHEALQPLAPHMPPVELHWRIHWFDELFSIDLLTTATRDDGVLVATPEMELAALLLYIARDGFTGVRMLGDIAAWWDRYGWNIRAERMADLPGCYPELRRSLVAASQVAESLVGVPLTSLFGGPGPAGSHRASLAASCADWALLDTEEVRMHRVMLVDYLLSPPASWHEFARRHVTPGDAALRQIYRIADGPSMRRLVLLRRTTHAGATAWGLARSFFNVRFARGGRSAAW